MLNLSKPENAPTLVSDPSDIRIGELLAAIDGHREKPLIFSYGGRPVRAGYHVTEVKAANFSALDCGANPEAWSEIFVQLWDVEEGERVHMTAGKFAAIIRKVTEHVLLDATAQLTFEVSDGVAPIQLHRAALPAIGKEVVQVELSPRPASCKPRDRWLAAEQAQASCFGGRAAAPTTAAGIKAAPSAPLQSPRPQTHPDKALQAQDKRQGRALHPNRPA